MDCFNHSCPFRVNETSSCNCCECVACPNRTNFPYTVVSNRTLTDKEVQEEVERIKSNGRTYFKR